MIKISFLCYPDSESDLELIGRKLENILIQKKGEKNKYGKIAKFNFCSFRWDIKDLDEEDKILNSIKDFLTKLPSEVSDFSPKLYVSIEKKDFDLNGFFFGEDLLGLLVSNRVELDIDLF